MNWTVEFRNATVQAELEAQPKELQARCLRIVDLIEGHGLEQVREPYITKTSVKPITQDSRSPMPGRVSDERQRQEVAEWKAITLPADAYAER